MATKLTRSSSNKMVGGVCAGVAEHFDWDPTIVRLAFLVACVFGGGGLWVYLIAWAIIPAADGSSGVKYAAEAWKESQAKRNGDSFDPYSDKR